MATLKEYVNAKKYSSVSAFAYTNLLETTTKIYDIIVLSIISIKEKQNIVRLPKEKRFISTITALIIGIIIGVVIGHWLAIILLPLCTYLLFCTIYIDYIREIEKFDPEAKVQRSESNTRGNAHWLREDEYDKVKHGNNINTFTGTILGCLPNGEFFGYKEDSGIGNGNLTAIGSSGSKKGTSLVNLNVLSNIMFHKSTIVTSTKDDVYALTHKIAEHKGATVRVLDLTANELLFSDGFNPLACIGDNSDLAGQVAKTILDNTTLQDTQFAKADYWSMGEEALFTVLVYMYCSNDRLEASLPKIFRAISQGQEYVEGLLELINDDSPVYELAQIYIHGDTIPKKQVLQGLGYRLGFLKSQEIKDLLGENDIDLTLPAHQFCVYYVIIPTASPYRPISSIFFTLLLFWLETEARKNGGSLEEKVSVIIDEAFAVGSIPVYPEKIVTSRSYGVELNMLTQTLPELKLLYPGKWESILNNSTKALLRTTDPETAEYFSKICGTFTGDVPKRDAAGTIIGTSEQEIPLASYDYLTNMEQDDIIVVMDGPGRIKGKKQEYFKDMPGSTNLFHNDRDGKDYLAHPMLKYYDYDPIYNRIPVRFLKISKQEY